jgi:outer membrane receptor protein involved in Fe transport
LSANPALNPNAAQVRAMCEAQMGVTGSTAYYAPGNIPGVSTLGNRTGNPSLHSENGDTMTIGAVLNFAESVQISIDAYEITITDYIAAQLGESVLFNPTYSPFTAACNQILRDSWQLRYGIDNLLDEEPVFTNATRYTRGTTTLGGFYDVLGRRAYVGMSVNF